MNIETMPEEFPFVQQLPKREKGRFAKLFDLVAEMDAITRTEGMLLPLRFTAKLLGVSRQRVDELVEHGKLRRFDVDRHPFITEKSCLDFCKTERKSGRPVNVPMTFKESLKRARSK